MGMPTGQSKTWAAHRVTTLPRRSVRARFPEVADRCHTLYNGVDTERFCPMPERALRGANDKAERLVYVGRLSPEKGVHVLIEAFAILAQSRPGLRLDLVGVSDTPRYLYLCPDPTDPATGTLEVFFGSRLLDMVRRQLVLRARSYLGDLATASAGDHRIVFHGAMAHTETIEFYRRAAVLVFPSVWSEPFGMPTIEAPACGLPVVSTYSGGIPEIVRPGQTGLLVERGNVRELALAISRILDNPVLASAMGEAGRTRAIAHFSWDAVSCRLAELIESVSPGE
jgi:glycosyltransferase involved in cell wall biosynthesis